MVRSGRSKCLGWFLWWLPLVRHETIAMVGAVIQNHNQFVPPLIVEPLMLTAVNVQPHLWQRPPFSPPAVLAPPLLPRHQPSPLRSQTLERKPAASCRPAPKPREKNAPGGTRSRSSSR
jgi:hypothetical protein